MSETLKNKSNVTYGHVSGRTILALLKAAKECGVPSSVLREAATSEPYEYYQVKRSVFLWNDFVAFIRSIYEYSESHEQLLLIGQRLFRCIGDKAYMRALSKFVSIQTAIRLTVKYPHNILNFEPTCEINGQKGVVTYKQKYDADIFYPPIAYVIQGATETFPVIFGYSAMEVSFEVNEDEKSTTFFFTLPNRMTWSKRFGNFVRTIFNQDTSRRILADHANNLAYIERQRQQDLETFYGVLDGMAEAVFITRGDRLFYKNNAFQRMLSGSQPNILSDCFDKITILSDLLEKEGEEKSVIVPLKRCGLPSIDVEVTILSVRIYENVTEALYKVVDASLPQDPREIVAYTQEEQRRSIARDMHDSLGQVLSATSFHVAALEISEQDDTKSKKLAMVSKLVREITLYTRRFTRHLDLLIDDCESIYEAANIIFDEFSTISGVNVINHIQEEFSIDHQDSIKNIAYIFQESLNNAYRHGKASEVKISTSNKDGVWELKIEDNGEGMDVSSVQLGLGLRSIEYRVEMMSGQMEVDSPTQGVVLMMKF